MSKVKISYEEAVKQRLTKKCSKCGEVKSVIEFGRDKKGKYGAKSMCKKCKAKYYQEHREEINNRQRKYDQEHKEERAKYKKQYDQEHKEEMTKYKRQYNQEHREEINNRKRKYNQEHREEIAKYNKQYNQAHKEEKAKYNKQYHQTPQGKENKRKAEQKHRALKNNSFYQPFTQEDKEFCLNYFNYTCPYTGKQLTGSVHIDHIVALSDRNKDEIGASAPWNLIVCDVSANMSKSNKPVLEFINLLPNPEEVYSRIRGYIILQAKKYIDIIPEDDITLKTFNISFEEIEG